MYSRIGMGMGLEFNFLKLFGLRNLDFGHMHFDEMGLSFDRLFQILSFYFLSYVIFYKIGNEFDLVLLLLLPFICFVSIVFHELGHYLVAWASGLKMNRFQVVMGVVSFYYFPEGEGNGRGIMGFSFLDTKEKSTGGFMFIVGHVLEDDDSVGIDEKNRIMIRSLIKSTWMGPLVSLLLALGSLLVFVYFGEWSFFLLLGVVNGLLFSFSILFSDGPMLWTCYTKPDEMFTKELDDV
jgi:hypothetical protein